MINRSESKFNHSWCVVQDDADNIAVLYANYPDSISYFQVSFEIIPFLFESFDLCTRPDDFIVTFNDQVATCFHGILPDDNVFWQYQESFGELITQQEFRRVELFYPSRVTYPLPWTDSFPPPPNRPSLLISIRRGSLSDYPLPSPQMRVSIKDTTKGDGEVLKLTIDINASFDSVTVTHQKWSEILPKNLAGTYFTVSEVDIL